MRAAIGHLEVARHCLQPLWIDDDDLCRIGDVDEEEALRRIEHGSPRSARHRNVRQRRVPANVDQCNGMGVRPARIPDVGAQENVPLRIEGEAVRPAAHPDLHHLVLGFGRKDPDRVFASIRREHEIRALIDQSAGYAFEPADGAQEAPGVRVDYVLTESLAVCAT